MKIRRVGNHQQVSLPGKSTGGGKGGRSGSWGGTARRPQPKPDEPSTPVRTFLLRQSDSHVLALAELPAVTVGDNSFTINTQLTESYMLHVITGDYDGSVEENASSVVNVLYGGTPVSSTELQANKCLLIGFDATSLGLGKAYASYPGNVDNLFTQAEVEDFIATQNASIESLGLTPEAPIWGYRFGIDADNATGTYTYTYSAAPFVPFHAFLVRATDNVIFELSQTPVTVDKDASTFSINTALTDSYILHIITGAYDGIVPEGSSSSMHVFHNGTEVTPVMTAQRAVLMPYDQAALGGTGLAYAAYTGELAPDGNYNIFSQAGADEFIADMTTALNNFNITPQETVWGYQIGLGESNETGVYDYSWTP